MVFVSIGYAALVALIFILSGLIMKYKPPKEINALYGYRTSRSMKNIDLWRAGNKYSAELMIKYSIVAFLIGVLISFLFEELIAILIISGLMLVKIVIMMIRVEGRLKELDEELQQRR
ncbi:SdpI family protein [Tumebacillus lipolyticus]|uniref:SdpI family protein n=1 Tax=Tumebacillus lipolyticus TaxID=1280370 RepID=A0ABW4ZXQ8_9BACL